MPRLAVDSVLLVALLGACTMSPASAQEPVDAVQLDRPLEDVIADLKTELKKKSSKGGDAEAARLVQQLGAAFEGDLAKRDAKKIRVIVAAGLQRYRIRSPQWPAFYEAAVDVMVQFGANGARELIKTFENTKRYPKYDAKWRATRSLFLIGAGRTRTPYAAKELCKIVVKTDEDQVLVACGQALGAFAGTDLPLRKEIVKVMVRRYSDLYTNASAIPPVDRARSLQDDVERFKKSLAAIREPWNKALSELTGASFTTATEWDGWWRDNKKRKWS